MTRTIALAHSLKIAAYLVAGRADLVEMELVKLESWIQVNQGCGMVRS